MNIVDSNSPDTGNQSFKMAQAINRHTEHTSISFVNGDNYLKFPYMVKYGTELAKGDWIQKYWNNADIIHIHNNMRRIKIWQPNISLLSGKILHQHGRDPNLINLGINKIIDMDYTNKWLRVVSTLNLLPYVNHDPKYWIPAPMDISFFENLKKEYYEEHDTIRICQTATGLSCKRTDVFVAAMKKVMEKHKNVEMVLVQNKPWLECQKIKASCDILFDQFLSYGTTCLESWCFDYPAITSMSKETYDIIEGVLSQNNIPFILCDEKNIVDVISNLVEDESLRKEYAIKGKKYVKEYHSYENVSKKMVNLYKESLEKFGLEERNIETIKPEKTREILFNKKESIRGRKGGTGR